MAPACAGGCVERSQTGRVRALERHAADFLTRVRHHRRHHVVCAMLLADGQEVLGLNIVSNLGVASVCAEQVTLGESLKRLETEVVLIVTLRATFNESDWYELVPPCGRCREVLCEYAPAAYVILRADASQTHELIPIDVLLPRPFQRRAQGHHYA